MAQARRNDSEGVSIESEDSIVPTPSGTEIPGCSITNTVSTVKQTAFTVSQSPLLRQALSWKWRHQRLL
jgi:hypothetical protein